MSFKKYRCGKYKYWRYENDDIVINPPISVDTIKKEEPSKSWSEILAQKMDETEKLIRNWNHVYEHYLIANQGHYATLNDYQTQKKFADVKFNLSNEISCKWSGNLEEEGKFICTNINKYKQQLADVNEAASTNTSISFKSFEDYMIWKNIELSKKKTEQELSKLKNEFAFWSETKHNSQTDCKMSNTELTTKITQLKQQKTKLFHQIYEDVHNFEKVNLYEWCKSYKTTVQDPWEKNYEYFKLLIELTKLEKTNKKIQAQSISTHGYLKFNQMFIKHPLLKSINVKYVNTYDSWKESIFNGSLDVINEELEIMCVLVESMSLY